MHHCAFNIALYGPGRNRWALTERPRGDVSRTATTFSVGPSAMAWDGVALTILLDEWTVPLPARIKGRVRLTPAVLFDEVTALDKDGRHGWLPLAPRARVEVDFTYPRLAWSGDAYLDCNFGAEPLEVAFTRWDWSRAHTPDGTLVLYDVARRDGSSLTVARRFDETGQVHAFEPPPPCRLPTTLWRMPRGTRSDAGQPASVIQTLEDTPFYARSLIEATLAGRKVTAVHESLSLDRVANPLVRLMIPFRMPRRAFNKPLPGSVRASF